MIRPVFGKRPAVPNRLDVILVPQGAVASAREWSLSEALDLFVAVAREDALFTPDELPADAVAVLEVYLFANDLLEGYGFPEWFGRARSIHWVEAIARGLRLLAAPGMADKLEQAAALWQAGGPHAERDAALQRVRPTEEEHGPLIRRCSEWVRHSPLTVVLGDGGRDTVYKQVMQQLFRCNAHYAERKAVEDERRIRMRLQPKPQLQGTRCTLDQLIAEMQRLHG